MMKWVFGADTTPFRRGLDDMRTQTKAFAGSVKGMLAGAFGVGAVTAAFHKLVTEMARVKDLADRFGESAETMQRVGFAASQSGSDVEGLARAMTVATKNAYAAVNGNKAMAESFTAMGIDAQSFLNMPMEEKILMMAKAMQSGKGSGETLAEAMKILGRSGGDMIPMLTQSIDDLESQLRDTMVVSDSTVESMAKLDDAFDSLKQKAYVLGAAIYDGFKIIFGSLGIFVGAQIGAIMAAFDLLVNSSLDVGKTFISVFTGDLDGAARAAKNFLDRPKQALDDLKTTAQITKEALSDLFNETAGSAPTNTGGSLPIVEGDTESIEKEKAKLAEDIAKLKEEAMTRELSLAEQILKLEEKRAALIESTDTETDEAKQLEAVKAALEVEKEIDAKKEEQKRNADAAAKKESDRIQKGADDIAELQKEYAGLQKENAFNQLSDEDKLASLVAEQEGLRGESFDAALRGDTKTELEKGIEAEKLTPQIEALAKRIEDDAPAAALPSVATSSLASIGAGGSANLLTRSTTAERQVTLLEIIARNTARDNTGNPKIPEPI